MFDRTRRLRLLFVTLIMASITIVTLDFRSAGDGPLDQVGRYAMAVIGPVQEGMAKLFRPVGNFFQGFTKVPSLKERIAALEAENATLRGNLQKGEDLTRENSSLRRLLVLRERLNLRTTTARVIGVSPSNFERTIFIDRGSAEGVRKDMPVIAGDGLAGRVVSVGPSTAQVILLVDRSSAVAGRIAGNGETGILSGDGSATLRFELFDPEAAVREGDQVVTSGYDDSLFPPGIPIGTVLDTPDPHASLSRVVTVQPFVDFSSLDHVLLVTGDRAGAGSKGGGDR